MPKAAIDQLLIASARDPELLRRLQESPEAVFADFELTPEQEEMLRHPDHRLLALLGAALARQSEPAATIETAAAEPAAPDPAYGRRLPDIRLALTLVPCAIPAEGRPPALQYAVWVNSLGEGVDPATLPAPPGAVLPGRPLAPLHAVVQVSLVQYPDVGGLPRIGMWAALRQASNILAPAERPADPEGAPVRAAAAAVRAAPAAERHERLLDLIRALRDGAAQ